MSDAMRLRMATEADVEAILGLEQESAEAPHWSAAAYRAAIGEESTGGAQSRRVLVAEAVSDDVWGAGVPGRGARELEARSFVVGFAVGRVLQLHEGEVEGEIESVAVAGWARRRGVGRALCRGLMAWCGKAGARVVELEVRAGNVGAIAMYAGLGFREVGRRRGYYAEPIEDAVLMQADGDGR